MEKAEVIKAFHLMWDNYPESAMLIDKKRNIIAANKVAPSTGRIEGNKCALVEPLEQHKGCRAEEAWKNGEASYRKKVGKLGDVVSFWIPVDGYPDYLVHFSVGSIQNMNITFKNKPCCNLQQGFI